MFRGDQHPVAVRIVRIDLREPGEAIFVLHARFFNELRQLIPISRKIRKVMVFTKNPVELLAICNRSRSMVSQR